MRKSRALDTHCDSIAVRVSMVKVAVWGVNITLSKSQSGPVYGNEDDVA